MSHVYQVGVNLNEKLCLLHMLDERISWLRSSLDTARGFDPQMVPIWEKDLFDAECLYQKINAA